MIFSNLGPVRLCALWLQLGSPSGVRFIHLMILGFRVSPVGGKGLHRVQDGGLRFGVQDDCPDWVGRMGFHGGCFKNAG